MHPQKLACPGLPQDHGLGDLTGFLIYKPSNEGEAVLFCQECFAKSVVKGQEETSPECLHISANHQGTTTNPAREGSRQQARAQLSSYKPRDELHNWLVRRKKRIFA